MGRSPKEYHGQTMSVLELDVLKMAIFLRENLIRKVNDRYLYLNYFPPVLDSILVTLGNSKGCGFERIRMLVMTI